MGLKLVVLLGLAGVAAMGLRLIQHRRFYRDLPTPPHSFLWGHLKLFQEVIEQFPPHTAVQVFYTTIAQKYGLRGIFYMDLWPFGPSQMVLLTPEAADKVLVTEFYPLHDFVPKFLGPLVGYQSIAAKDGQTWKMLHNLMAPTFRPSIVKSMVPIIASKAMTIFRPTLAEYASSGQIFSMEKLSAQLIFSISSHAILGDILSEQENEELLMELEHTLDYGRILSLASLPNPLEKVSKWWRKRRAVKRTEEILSSLVLKRYAFICQETSNGSDIGGAFSGVLDRMLLECQKLDSSSKSNGKLSENSMRLITDNLRTLFVAGYSTTRDSLCAIFALLSLHPNVVEKLRQEHNRVFDADIAKTEQMLQEFPQKTNELEYTKAVIKEALRMFPLGFPARAAKPGTDTFHYEGRSYPTANQMIISCTHAIHYDPEIFPMPSHFDPERFVEPRRPPPGAWRPFERGPRACIGQGLAMEELQTVLLLTVREFDFAYASITPSTKPIASYTDLDLKIGDLAFQETALSAKLRGGTMMKVTAI